MFDTIITHKKHSYVECEIIHSVAKMANENKLHFDSIECLQTTQLTLKEYSSGITVSFGIYAIEQSYDENTLESYNNINDLDTTLHLSQLWYASSVSCHS